MVVHEWMLKIKVVKDPLNDICILKWKGANADTTAQSWSRYVSANHVVIICVYKCNGMGYMSLL